MRDLSPRLALGAMTTALMCLSLMNVAQAQETTTATGGGDAVRSSSFGIGIGSVTKASGLSLKVPMGPTSIQAAFGLGGYGLNTGFGVGADFLLEMPALVDAGFVVVAWELGLGGGLATGGGGDDLSAAVSGVAGLQFNFGVLPGLPFDLVIEWRPTLNIIQNVDLNLLGATGHLRIYF